MQDAIDRALVEARGAGASRVQSLRLRVGALSGVVPEALQFAFDALTAGTPAEGASLDIEAIPAAYWCERCDVEYVPQDLGEPCPQCGDGRLRLLRGLEIELTSVEVS